MTLRELLDRYALLMNLSDRSVSLYGHTIDKFQEFLGREPMVADLEDVAVSKFLRWRAANPCRGRVVSPHTVAKDRSQLLAIWNWACRKKLHPGEWPGLPRQKRVKRAPTAYTVDEMSRLVKAARQRRTMMSGLPSAWWWSTLLQSAWQTGERIGALLNLRWREVDTASHRLLFLAETRKGRERDLVSPITAELAAELDEHRGPPDALVWPRTGHPLSHYASMRLLCKTAGVPSRAFHAIRKASASYVAAGGGDATAHLGHADPAMTRGHYLDPRITETARGLDYLPPLDLNGPPKDEEVPPRKPR
jgi:integrase